MMRKSKANANCPSNFDLDQGSLGKAFRSRFELDWSEAFFADVEVSSGAATGEREPIRYAVIRARRNGTHAGVPSGAAVTPWTAQACAATPAGRKCEACGTPIKAQRAIMRLCSVRCRVAAHRL
jgi:hypothetical protein